MKRRGIQVLLERTGISRKCRERACGHGGAWGWKGGMNWEIIPTGLSSQPIPINIFVSDFAKVLEAIFITLALTSL